MSPGEILFLYSDGVYDGSDDAERSELKELMRAHSSLSAKEICNAVLAYTVGNDQRLRDRGEEDLVDGKTAFIIKRSYAEP